jgi:hypothetical protein
MTPSYILRDTDVREHAIARLRCLNLDVPEPWAIYIAPYKRIRTLEQNAAYFRVVDAICKATGHGKNVIHTYLKQTYLGVEIADIGGKRVEAVRSSAKVDRGDMSELIEGAYQLAAEMGVPVE